MDQLTRSVMYQALLELHERDRTTVLFITHDIEEAVFLGDRVSVMTARPGRIKETIPVDGPVEDVVAQVENAVIDEARKAFA
jgi:NitT/TauT family transport system ATP-binding protein